MKGKSRGFRKQRAAAAILAVMLLAAGCGSVGEKAAVFDSVTTESIAEEAPAAMAEGALEYNEESRDAGMGENGVDVNGNAQAANRKLIREVNLSVETRDFDKLMTDVSGEIEALGGYIESSDIYSDSIYADPYAQPASFQNRSGSIMARIPAERLDEFLNQVTEISNVTYRSENVKDVTLQYVDMESHKNALETEQKRLLELLAQAESIEDVIAIEGRLSEVRYQIESMESQLRTLDNQIDYSTVYMDIREVARMTPVETNQGAWERIRVGFSENIYRVGEGLSNFAIGFVISLPFILVWAVGIAVLAAVVMLVYKKGVKRRERRKGVKEQKAAAQPIQEEGKEKKEENNGK